MTDIRFRCAAPVEAIAARLAYAVYDSPPRDGVPFPGDGERWLELSTANDHKLDLPGPNGWPADTYRFRQRYPVAERAERVVAAIVELGGEVIG